MEIEQLRKELNDLLDNVVEHSSNYSGNRQIPSLEISYVLTKINKMQETLIILKHLIKEEEKQLKKEKQQKRQLAQETVVKETETEKVELVVQAEIVVEEKQPEKEELPVTKVEEVKESIIEGEGVIEQQTPPITNIEQLPITKLVDAFSLNDRYLYANELFGKDMGAFNEVVKNIDVSNNFEEAKTILMNIGSERNWDVEDENVLSFTNLVERRFL